MYSELFHINIVEKAIPDRPECFLSSAQYNAISRERAPNGHYHTERPLSHGTLRCSGRVAGRTVLD